MVRIGIIARRILDDVAARMIEEKTGTKAPGVTLLVREEHRPEVTTDVSDRALQREETNMDAQRSAALCLNDVAGVAVRRGVHSPDGK